MATATRYLSRSRTFALFTERSRAAALVAICLGVFAALGLVVALGAGAPLEIDAAIQRTVVNARGSWLDGTMAALTFLGTRYAIGAMTAGLVVWSLVTGRQRGLVTVIVLAVLLNPIVEVGIKELFGRARPDLARLVPGNGPSFPSGHVVATAGFYGLLPFLVREVSGSRLVRIAAAVGAASVILVVAASRVWLDVHWTTDVVAGLVVGTVLVVAALQAHLLRIRPVMTAGEPVLAVVGGAV